jgi:hypothetical protein
VYSCERDEAHHELDVALNEFNLDAQDLTRGLVGAVGESGALTTIVSQFERALTSLSVPPEDPDTPFMASLDAIQSTVSTLNENLPMLSQVSGDRLLSTIQDLKIVDSFNGPLRVLFCSGVLLVSFICSMQPCVWRGGRPLPRPIVRRPERSSELFLLITSRIYSSCESMPGGPYLIGRHSD